MSRAHKILDTWFKNREVQQRYYNGQNKPEPKEPEKEEKKTVKEGKMSAIHADIEDHLGKHLANYKKTGGAEHFGAKTVDAAKKIAKAHGIEHQHAQKLVNDYVDSALKEAVDKEHPIYKEYQGLKNHSIKDLRDMIKRQHRIVDTSEFRTKEHAISHILHNKHGAHRMKAVFGEETEQIEEDKNGSWVVHKDGEFKGRFATHKGAKAHAEKHGAKVASSEYYNDHIAPKKNVKEEVEQIDEISKQTLGNYIKRSSHDAALSARHGGSDPKELKNVIKRLKGIAKATNKLTQEETDLDEGAKSKPAAMTHTQYDAHDREERQMRDLVHGREGGVQKDTFKNAKTVGIVKVKEDMDTTTILEALDSEKKKQRLRDALDRHTEKAVAANRAGDHDAVKVHQQYMNKIKNQMARLSRNESVEEIYDNSDLQLDEISKQTLGSYVKKASADIAKREVRIDRALDPSGSNYNEPSMQKALNKNTKRVAGLNKATDKLTKEETEQIDELSKKTLGSYAKSAAAQTLGLSAALGAMKTVDSAVEAQRKLRNRYQGTQKAITKLAKEETELDEAWSVNGRNPQRGIKVGHKVRSYDFPGMHDDHYVEGHVVGETPSSYHIKVGKVVRAGKEVPVPAHMAHVEAPKGQGIFSNAYAVHKIRDDKAETVANKTPEPAGAAKTFNRVRGKK